MQKVQKMTAQELVDSMDAFARCGAKVYAAQGKRGKQVTPWYLNRAYLRAVALTAMGLDDPVTEGGSFAGDR